MNISFPMISAVIVTWNAKKYVEECLRSLRDNTDVPIETIVVDNASKDGTNELVKDEFPNIKLIQNEKNLGFAKANNIGISQSHGKYICLVNSDVNVFPGCLRKLIEFMEANPKVGLLGPQMLGPQHDIRRSSSRLPTIWNTFCRALALEKLFPGSRFFGAQLMSDFQHDRTMEVEVLNGWFWVVRREAMEQVGYLDERFFIYGEDIDWCHRFRDAGWRLVFYAEASSLHYGGASSSAAPTRFYIEMQRANLQYWKKHHGYGSCFCYCCAIFLHQFIRAIAYSLAYLSRANSCANYQFKARRSLATLGWMLGMNKTELF
jgi:hypothetical protein